jgi:hypothetical protein
MDSLRQALRACALLLSLLSFSACSDGTAPQGDFRFTGRWAGTAWLGDADALFVAGANTDTLYVFGVRPINAGPLPQETIRVRVPFNGPGAYELAGDAVDFVVLTGGDVVSAGYTGQSPAAGALVVDSYDPATELITGTVSFTAVAVSEYRPYGSSAQFDSGRFRASARRVQ